MELSAYDTKNEHIYITDIDILKKYLSDNRVHVVKIELYYELTELMYNNVFVTKLIKWNEFEMHNTIKLDSRIDIVYEVVYHKLRGS